VLLINLTPIFMNTCSSWAQGYNEQEQAGMRSV
jgi:hypothetical protein